MWLVATVLGLLAVGTRLVSPADAASVVRGVAPVLLFLVGITVVAELADAAGVFDVAATVAARLGGGRTRRLFVLLAVLGTLTTVVLSLDTTAVLLTPVVLAVAQRLGLRAQPFALLAVWLANTASLLLPVSNLTNLLALHARRLSTIGFAARMALPALTAVLLTVALLLWWYRRDLRGGYPVPAAAVPPDQVLFRMAAAVCLALGPCFAIGLPVAPVALAAAALLAVPFALRRRKVLRPGLLPWRLVLLVVGLFLAVEGAGRWLDPVLTSAAGTSAAPFGVLRTVVTSAVGSNLVNNLPAYFAVQRVVGDRSPQLFGLLLGTNVGPLVTVWASLATLLWRDRCRGRGVTVSAAEFARLGLVGVPLLLIGTWAALLAGPGA